ncbi:MarR family transcriptional regulator [Candidatus Acetothermia bacterium]|nr:MarR family transcriptional regulator [Candidatus Acetothermia bacterium]MBI3644285.1 MarR family transcriptional regulator [Candidatus Acetothermia bacterium]
MRPIQKISKKESGDRKTGSGVPMHIFQITRELRTALDRRMAEFGLTSQQAFLLIRSLRNWGASPNQLMPQMGTDNAGLTRLIDRLEEASLVTRRTGENDRRSIWLEATGAGLALAPKLERVMQRTDRQLIAGLSAEEVAQLNGLLSRVLDNARNLEEE